MYTFEFREGNYFWDKQNHRLIKYGEVCPCGYQTGTSLAFPIPINEELLEIIGFTNNNGQYVYVDDPKISIKIDGINLYGILTLFGKTVVFLNDIQNAFEDEKHFLLIDENKLKGFLLRP